MRSPSRSLRLASRSRARAIRLLAWALGAAWLAAATPAGADPASRDPGGPNLDQLLKLPTSSEYSTERKAGATRSEWRQRFHEARTSVANAEAALQKAQDKLADAAGSKSEWQFSPAGLPAEATEEGTTSYQLRQEVKRQRSEVERSKARLRDLEVEANLAGVPEDWRDASTEARSGNDSVTAPPPSK